ncbi:MAG TPA: YciI family protein [Blastocatellia bacterium]|jgi:uncharacterized protein YciI
MNFAIIYKPTRNNFLATMTAEEQQAIESHFNYLNELLKADKLFMAGRCEDASFGVAIIDVSSEDEADTIIDRDPAVASGVFEAELKQWRMALTR